MKYMRRVTSDGEKCIQQSCLTGCAETTLRCAAIRIDRIVFCAKRRLIRGDLEVFLAKATSCDFLTITVARRFAQKVLINGVL